MSLESTSSVAAEEKFTCLLKFASVKQIKGFLVQNPSMYLHYPTPNMSTPLTAAVDRGDVQVVSLLIDKNPTPLDETLTQPCQRTALMYASFVSRSPEMLQLLLKRGADANKTDTRGWTCLQYAVVGERGKNVSFLLDHGVSVDLRDIGERTPLMIAVYLSNLEILALLLDRGADVEARDEKGLTALQLAILWRKRDAAVALIERGSDVTVVTPVSKVPLGELCKTTMPNILRCIE